MGHMDILMELQRNKVLESLKTGKRVSNRAFDEYRSVDVQTNVSENANGSARVRVGKTDVIAGTKFSVGTPYPDSPDEGSISVGAELTPLASPLNEVGPPSTHEVELSRVVDRAIRESHAVDLNALCLVEGEKVLSLFIDVYAVNDDGNLFDAASMAALAALNTTRLSKVEDNVIQYGEYDGMLKMANQPLLSTIYKVGGHLLSDADLGEEKAMTARFSFGGTEKGVLTAFQKGGSGSFTMDELDKSVEMGLKNAKMLRKLLKG